MRKALIVTIGAVLCLILALTGCVQITAPEQRSNPTGIKSTETAPPSAESVATETATPEPPISGAPQTESELAGLWHESPVVGSGFSARLLLEGDHSFIWLASQMDEDERINTRSGSWRAESGRLELNIAEEIYRDGERMARLADSQLMTYEVSPVTVDTEVMDKKTVTIGGAQYWELAATEDKTDFYADYESLMRQTEVIPKEEALNLVFDYAYGDEMKSQMRNVKFIDTAEFYGYEYQFVRNDGALSDPWSIEFLGMSSDGGYYLFRLYERVYDGGEFNHAVTGNHYAVNAVTREIISEQTGDPPENNEDFPW